MWNQVLTVVIFGLGSIRLAVAEGARLCGAAKIFSVDINSDKFEIAFALVYEAGINTSTIDGNLVPFGGLITFVQRGIQYLESEANLSYDDTDMDEDFQFIQPIDLITKDVYELQKIIKEKRKSFGKTSLGETIRITMTVRWSMNENLLEKERRKKIESESESEKEKEKGLRRIKREKNKDKEKPREDLVDVKPNGDKEIVRHEENGKAGDPEPMEICTSSTSLPCQITSSDLLILEGHTSEVFACAWSPDGSLLASGARTIFYVGGLFAYV